MIHLILTIMLVGLSVTVLTDLLPLKPAFAKAIYFVAVAWMIYVIFGYFGAVAPLDVPR